MRASTDAEIAEREQSDLFGNAMPGEASLAGSRRRGAPTRAQPPAGQPLMVPIDRIDDDPRSPRTECPQDWLDDLAKDIAERGVLQPIVTAPPDTRGRYRIHFGALRWRAARLAGLPAVPVTVRQQPCEAYDQVAENLKRHGLSPLELARFMRSRVEAGESNLEIARKLAIDPTTVTHHLTLLELPPVLDAALESGRCTAPRTLHELHRLHADQPDVVAALLAGGAPVTRGAVAALRKSAPKSAYTGSARMTPSDEILKLLERSQLLCVRLDRLVTRLADAGIEALPGEQLVTLRQRLSALVQRLGG